MNRQVVACVLTLLTASTVSASDSVNWMSGQLEKLQTVRTGCAKSYDFIRSRCVNSSLLGKCPQALQKIVKDNFGMMTIVTGATVSGLGLWYVSNRRYASNFRNGTEDHRTQELKKLIPKLTDKLTAIPAKQLQEMRDGKSVKFSLSSSCWRPNVLSATFSQKDEDTTLVISDYLQPSASCSFPMNGVFQDDLKPDATIAQSIATVLAGASKLTGHVHFNLVDNGAGARHFVMVSDDFADALNSALRDERQLPTLHHATADQLQSGVELSSNDLLELMFIGKNEDATVRLRVRRTLQEINFALQKSSNHTMSALEQLQLFWTTKFGMRNGIRDVMSAYATHILTAGDQKELNVRLSPAGVINISREALRNDGLLIVDASNAAWVLTAKGAVVWPLLPDEQLHKHELADVLSRFLDSELQANGFVGSKEYVVELDNNPAQAVICTIAKQADDAACSSSDVDDTDRIITIDANGKRLTYKLTGHMFAGDQLADETLRTQMITCIADVHHDTPMTHDFELRLVHIKDAEFYYAMFDNQGRFLWDTRSFNIASSSNDVGQSSSSQDSGLKQSSSLEIVDEEEQQPVAGLDPAAPGLSHFDADQASTSIDAEQASSPDTTSAVAAMLLTGGMASKPDDVPSAAPANPEQLADDPASFVEEALQPLADLPEGEPDSNPLSVVDPLYEEQVAQPASSDQPAGSEQSANLVMSEEQGLPAAGPASSQLVIQSGDWGVACIAPFSDGEELGSFDTSEGGEEESEEGEEDSDDEDPADAPASPKQPVGDPASTIFDLFGPVGY